MKINFIASGQHCWLLLCTLFCGFNSVCSRIVPNFHNVNSDLDVAAAEPRPVFVELIKHPPLGVALPITYNPHISENSPPEQIKAPEAIPLTDASEKVEKILRRPIAFSYNKVNNEKIHHEDDADYDQSPDGTLVEHYNYGGHKKQPPVLESEPEVQKDTENYDVHEHEEEPNVDHDYNHRTYKDNRHKKYENRPEEEQKHDIPSDNERIVVANDYNNEQRDEIHDKEEQEEHEDVEPYELRENEEKIHPEVHVEDQRNAAYEVNEHSHKKHGHGGGGGGGGKHGGGGGGKHGGGGGGKHGGGGGGGGKHGGGGGGGGKHGGGGGGGGGGGKFEKGGGKKYHADHHGSHGEKGDKGYKGEHKFVKKEKGHHDKEGHKGEYKDEGGKNKKEHEEAGHFGEYNKGEKGEKGSSYKEEGKHSKGHSTKGEHNIHKKDEYEKKQEFYDEHHEGGEHEKHGGYKHEDDYHKGGHKKGGHKKGGHHEDHYGKKDASEKGGHYHEDKGHKKAAGHDDHHSHGTKYGKKDEKHGGKKWAYKKGSGGGGGGGGGGGKKHGGGGGGGKKHGHHGSHSHLTYAVQEKKPIQYVEKRQDTILEDNNPSQYVENVNRRQDIVVNDESSPEEVFNSKPDDVFVEKQQLEPIKKLKPKVAFNKKPLIDRFIDEHIQTPLETKENIKPRVAFNNKPVDLYIDEQIKPHLEPEENIKPKKSPKKRKNRKGKKPKKHLRKQPEINSSYDGQFNSGHSDSNLNNENTRKHVKQLKDADSVEEGSYYSTAPIQFTNIKHHNEKPMDDEEIKLINRPHFEYYQPENRQTEIIPEELDDNNKHNRENNHFIKKIPTYVSGKNANQTLLSDDEPELTNRRIVYTTELPLEETEFTPESQNQKKFVYGIPFAVKEDQIDSNRNNNESGIIYNIPKYSTNQTEEQKQAKDDEETISSDYGYY